MAFGPFIEYGRASYDSYLDDISSWQGKSEGFAGGIQINWAF